MYVQKLFSSTISAKPIQLAHQALQKTIDYALKTEREFLLVEGVQQAVLYSHLTCNHSNCY